MRALVLKACGEEHFAPVERLAEYGLTAYILVSFPSNVYGLPPQVVHECVMGAIEARLASLIK